MTTTVPSSSRASSRQLASSGPSEPSLRVNPSSRCNASWLAPLLHSLFRTNFPALPQTGKVGDRAENSQPGRNTALLSGRLPFPRRTLPVVVAPIVVCHNYLASFRRFLFVNLMPDCFIKRSTFLRLFVGITRSSSWPIISTGLFALFDITSSA